MYHAWCAGLIDTKNPHEMSSVTQQRPFDPCECECWSWPVHNSRTSPSISQTADIFIPVHVQPISKKINTSVFKIFWFPFQLVPFFSLKKSTFQFFSFPCPCQAIPTGAVLQSKSQPLDVAEQNRSNLNVLLQERHDGQNWSACFCWKSDEGARADLEFLELKAERWMVTKKQQSTFWQWFPKPCLLTRPGIVVKKWNSDAEFTRHSCENNASVQLKAF